jgi:hypothetical protein
MLTAIDEYRKKDLRSFHQEKLVAEIMKVIKNIHMGYTKIKFSGTR